MDNETFSSEIRYKLQAAIHGSLSRARNNKTSLSPLKDIELISAGSSLKLCTVAEGKADIYPRLGPTMEWDTAAAHAVAKYSGKKVINYETKNELVYNKENLLNPYFIVK